MCDLTVFKIFMFAAVSINSLVNPLFHPYLLTMTSATSLDLDQFSAQSINSPKCHYEPLTIEEIDPISKKKLLIVKIP